MSIAITQMQNAPFFTTYSDSCLPMLPSYLQPDCGNRIVYTKPFSEITHLTPLSPLTPIISPVFSPVSAYVNVLEPIGATIVIPGSMPLPSYMDLNKDSRVHKQVSKYFRYKTLDKWLYEDMNDLLGFFKVGPDGVHIARNAAEVKEDTQDTPENKEKKIAYIEKYYLTADTMRHLLSKLHTATGINWYDMTKSEMLVKEYIKDQLKKIFKETISENTQKGNK